MIKKIIKILGSPALMTLLFGIFISALMVGTFMDASAPKSPSPYTEQLIYKAKWFEVVLFLFVLSFFAHSLKFQLIKRRQWTTLFLHFGFGIIIIGAAITRYTSYEGIMNIREGQESNVFYSYDQFLHQKIDGFVEGKALRMVEEPVLLRLSERMSNEVNISTTFDNQKFTVTLKDFMKNVRIEKEFILDTTGKTYLKIVEGITGTRIDYFLEKNKNLLINGEIIAFEDSLSTASIQFIEKRDTLFIKSFRGGSTMNMISGEVTDIIPEVLYPLEYLQLYRIGSVSFVIPEKTLVGNIEEVMVRAPERQTNGIVLEVALNQERKIVNLLNGALGVPPVYKRIEIGKYYFHLAYGAREYQLPFALKLDDFKAEKFPGNELAYKSFSSEVTLKDKDQSDTQKEIAMNQVLDHKGFRFFQASFDNDEKGTYLSVNHDFWGTWVSYFGYVVLFLALIVSLFNSSSRFQHIAKSMKKLRNTPIILLFLLTISSSNIYASSSEENRINPSHNFIKESAINSEMAKKYGQLVSQDEAGRMKPINTYGAELLNKISKQNYFDVLTSDQVLFSMMQFPEEWIEVDLIYIKRANDSIRQVLQIPPDKKFASLNDFYTNDKKLKISPQLVQKISKGFNPNQFEKDILRAYQNQYLLGQALEGRLLRIFPIPNDPSNKWLSYHDFIDSRIDYGDPAFVENCKLIFNKGRAAPILLNNFIDKLKEVQEEYGRAIIPSETKIESEILYNKLALFKQLFKGYLFLGIVLLLVAIINILLDNRLVKRIAYVLKGMIFGLVVAHFGGLVWRWYLSGHAPWSDAYESMIYVAFATLTFGLLLGKHSYITIAASAFVTSMILMVAQWSFIDPAIANLQPVLDSYWLMIHVAVIVGSYGPFTLSMILGIIYLILTLFLTEQNYLRINRALKELSYINEMSLTIGLIMLVIGNFLGAMWANESWGRYWGWDPKETWALISIMVYAFILHMRFIPKLRGELAFNIASVLAYASILMTYFGVNFYMTGLHSYANGEKVITPQFIWVILGVTLLLIFSASIKLKTSLKIKGNV